MDEAQKFDEGKLPIHLVPSAAVEGVARVLAYGAKKYAAHNFRKGMKWSRLYSAAMRHLLAWNAGQDLDPESRLPHLEHAACCLAMLLDADRLGHGEDDRYRHE